MSFRTGPSQLKPYACPFCFKDFGNASSLGNHRPKCKKRTAAHAESYSKRKVEVDELANAAKRARKDEEDSGDNMLAEEEIFEPAQPSLPLESPPGR
ncbi:hypothetical protein L227DRAFT_617104 [Lentinus tigrinus ALCF2SS1-6]|uniref:C2H2-type domain-containing protein n=1 Tax=Lentinus tigrinus ALCF2SS1-6 TaxID=1328759 RepID=A0A5C2RQD5_9APHY|nr:hypothetical protein L227DRAFT_617104 [Lentinus tigrinus ALCF2SS1-6]